MNELGRVSLKQLVEMANSHVLDAADDVWSIIDGHDVVFAVWEDDRAEHGVERAMIKGKRFLNELTAPKKLGRARITAIPCKNAAEAEALRLVIGHEAKLH